MSYGFHNKILRVDLSTGDISVEEPGEKFYRMYYGGWGIIAHYLLKETAPDIDPLGPDNLLIFAPGILTGVPLGGGGRNAVGGKSPLTGGFGAAEAGGDWGAELRRAGWDAIIIRGQAKKPVYLWIQDDKVEIRDAAHLWGKRTAEVEELIQGASASPSAAWPARTWCATPASSTTSPAPRGAPAWARSWAPSGSRPSPCAARVAWIWPTASGSTSWRAGSATTS